MVRAAAVALAIAISQPSLAQESESQPARPFAWFAVTPTDSIWYAFEDEITRHNYGGATVWIHGYHLGDKTVNYRTSVYRLELDCSGGYKLLAYTTYKADGTGLNTWDGYGPRTYIRPDSLYDSLEKRACKK